MSEDRQGFANVGVELLQPVALSKRYAITNVDELGVIERFRFADIAHEVAHWAQLFREKGLQPGDRVVVLADREWQWRCALLGVLYAGGVAVPCPASASAAEIEAISTDASARLLVSIRPRPSLPEEGGRAVLSTEELSALGSAHALDQPAHRSLPEDEALILYSPTSTGLRGVVHTHASLISQASAGEHWLGVGEDERVLSSAEDGSAASIWVLLAAWRNRANVVSLELEPEAQLELLDKLRPAAVWFSDDEYGILASATAPPWVDLGPIRRALISDESSAGVTAFAQAFGARVAPLLARMELGVIAGWPPGAEHKAAAETGLPVPGVQLAIVDEHGAQLPSGEVGNVVVRADSPSLFSGYTDADGSRVSSPWLNLGWQGALSADGTLRVVSRSVETELVDAEVDLPAARTAEASPEVGLAEPEPPSRQSKREAKRAKRGEAREANKRDKAEERRRREVEPAKREAAEAQAGRSAEDDEQAQRQAEAAVLAERDASEAEARRRAEEAKWAEREAAEAEARPRAEEEQARRQADEEAEERKRAEAAALAERETKERRRVEDEKSHERKRTRTDRKAQRQAKREARERGKEEAARAKREAAEAEERRRREEKEAKEWEKAEAAARAEREAEERRLTKERAKEDAARAEREAAEAKEREKEDAARAKREAAEAEEGRRREEKEAKEREKAEAAARAEREAEEQRQAKEAARAERQAARQRRGRRHRREEKEARRRAEQEAKEREKAEAAERAAREAEERRRAEEEARAPKERERERQREEKEAARAQRKAARATRFRRTKESAPAENAKRTRKRPSSAAAEDAEPERLNTEMVARIKQYGMAGSQSEPDEPPETEAVNPQPTAEPERADSD